MNAEVNGEVNMDNASIEEVILSNNMTEAILRAFLTIDFETASDYGANYKPLYYGIFNGISQILENVSTYGEIVAALKHLQCIAEDAYINQKSTGFIRTVDEMGRVIIPREYREALGVAKGGMVDVSIDGGVIMLKRYTLDYGADSSADE